MTIYIQTKDNVAFAYVVSDKDIINSIKLDSGVDPNTIMGKSYVNGEWIESQKIYFIEKINTNGMVESVNHTLYASEVTGEIVPEYVEYGWKKENGEWVNFLEIEKERVEQEQKNREEEYISMQISQILESKPYPSWIWHNGGWVPPTPKPEVNDYDYYWDEESLSWQLYIDSEEDQYNQITE